jgi:hypothetical protein
MKSETMMPLRMTLLSIDFGERRSFRVISRVIFIEIGPIYTHRICATAFTPALHNELPARRGPYVLRQEAASKRGSGGAAAGNGDDYELPEGAPAPDSPVPAVAEA